MEDLLPRIKEIMEWVGVGPASFADEIGIGRPVMSHVVSGRNKASLEVAQKILVRFPDISSNWLLLGSGQMLKELEASAAPAHSHLPIVEERFANQENAVYNVKMQKADSSPVLPATQKIAEARKLVKVILFYEDGSFESFNP